MYFPEWVLWVLTFAGTFVVGASVIFLLTTLAKESRSKDGAI